MPNILTKAKQKLRGEAPPPQVTPPPIANVTSAPINTGGLAAPKQDINIPNYQAPSASGYTREGVTLGQVPAGTKAGWIKTPSGWVPAGSTISGNISNMQKGNITAGNMRPDIAQQLAGMEAGRQQQFQQTIGQLGTSEAQSDVVNQIGTGTAYQQGLKRAGQAFAAGSIPAAFTASTGVGAPAAAAALAATTAGGFIYGYFGAKTKGAKQNVREVAKEANLATGEAMSELFRQAQTGELHPEESVRAFNDIIRRTNADYAWLYQQNKKSTDDFVGQSGDELVALENWYRMFSTPGSHDLVKLRQRMADTLANPNPDLISYQASQGTNIPTDEGVQQ